MFFIYFFFTTCEISEMRGPTGVKFCTMVSNRPYFIMPVQNLHPKKISEAKNMQNLARFWTTSKFGGEYLLNRSRYSKSDFYFIYRNSSCVMRNKSGELWSSNLGNLSVNSYPPKANFSEDHISAPRGSPSLTSAPPTGDGGPPYNFFQRGVKKLA